eukprot:191983_1
MKKNITTINVMLNAYCINEMNSECLKLFRNIETISCNLKPDIISYQNVLQACANDVSLETGKEISEELKRLNVNWLNDVVIQMNLIHMYGKCGHLDKCDELFDEIRTYQYDVYQNEIIIWNAMIHAYGRNGYLKKVKELLALMMKHTNLYPDRQTYIDILNTYGHCDGEENINEAMKLWNEINNIFAKYDCIVVTTIVDCLARKNYLNHAYGIIMDFETQTEEVYYAMWLAILSGCRKFQNKLIAQKIYNDMTNRFKPNDHCMTHANLLLSHIKN